MTSDAYLRSGDVLLWLRRLTADADTVLRRRLGLRFRSTLVSNIPTIKSVVVLWSGGGWITCEVNSGLELILHFLNYMANHLPKRFCFTFGCWRTSEM